MSNFRGGFESQDEESQRNVKFELSLSQLLDQPFLMRYFRHPREEAGSFRSLKQPRVERRWHSNLNVDARVLVIFKLNVLN